MNNLLRRCKECGSYTMEMKCPKCGSTETGNPHPPRFSPDDKYLRYRVAGRYAPDAMKKTESLLS